MKGIKEDVSRERPCIFCSHGDWCFRVTGEFNVVSHFCARVDAEGTFLCQGIEYVRVGTSDNNTGTHYVYQAVSERKRGQREWAKIHNPNPNFKAHNKKNAASEPAAEKPRELTLTPKTKEKEQDAELRSPQELDAFYRYFLSMLTLEEKHRQSLLKEWGKRPELLSLIDTWQIRSLPPVDYQRFSGKERLKNPSRKQLCNKLVEKFGDLKGFPGFYQKDSGEWTFVAIEGIIFPTFDTDGLMTRIRIKDDYPNIVGEYKGVIGTFFHKYDKGVHKWFFEQKREPGRTERYPSVETEFHSTPSGKADGKYKNFASNPVYYKNGTRSGSSYSLYCKPGDNFTTVYITEGEKKAMVANAILNVPVISLPGVGAIRLLLEKAEDGFSVIDSLKGYGMRFLAVCFDADKNENMKVLASEQKAVLSLIKEGLQVGVGEWNASFGKGLDDILVQKIMPTVYRIG